MDCSEWLRVWEEEEEVSDDVCVGVECRMTGDIGEGQLPLCLCHHIITSWDSPTSVDNRSSVVTDKNGNS